MLIDIHGHPPRAEADTQRYLDALARWDSRLLVAALGPRAKGWQNEPEIDDWRIANDECAQFVRQHPERLAAYVYVNPAHTREALDELECRFLKEPGPFVALKLWVAVRASDPRLDPLMEFCAAHAVPVLQHTWMKVGPDGPGAGNLPGESTPLDLLALARRHPRVQFFGGHIGGDWEWGVAALKQVDNVFLDVAGGESAGAYAQIALRAVGSGRIVYGTDVPGRSVPSQLSKILCLDVSSDDLDCMLWKNAALILGERLPAAWGVGGAAAATSA
ncbi:MAG TPA: amidohydrolase family protein, partial [Chloroflexota bacterium]|nr:amidohydrolase family protein [Chloroflexota bacterium]